MSPVLVTYTMHAYVFQSQVINNNFSVTEHIIAHSKDRKDFKPAAFNMFCVIERPQFTQVNHLFYMNGYSMSVK